MWCCLRRQVNWPCMWLAEIAELDPNRTKHEVDRTTGCGDGHLKFLQNGGGRHLEFVRTGNSAIRPAVPENHTLEPNMKWIGRPVAEIWPFEIFEMRGLSSVGRSWIYTYFHWSHILLFATLGTYRARSKNVRYQHLWEQATLNMFYSLELLLCTSTMNLMLFEEWTVVNIKAVLFYSHVNVIIEIPLIDLSMKCCIFIVDTAECGPLRK